MMKIRSMLKADWKNISRDAISFIILLVPVMLFFVMKFLIPFIREFSLQWFDLQEYYILIFSLFFIMVPYMTGILAGFLFLDERDQHILEAIAVTPLQRRGHLWFRSSTMMLLSVVLALGLYSWSGLVEPDWIRLILVAIVSSLEVPLFALLLLSVAHNKVEGLAISKFLGLISFAPIIAFFLEGAWKYTMAWSPPFWMVQAYLSDSTAGFWLHLSVGLVFHVVLLLLLIKRMENVAE